MNRLELKAGILRTNNVANLNAVGGDAHPLAVDRDVAVGNQLTGRRDGRGETGAEDHIVQTTLKELEKLVACTELRLTSLEDQTAELALAKTVVVTELLLLGQLTTVVRDLPPTRRSMLAGSGRAAIHRLAGKTRKIDAERTQFFDARTDVSRHA